MIRGKMAVLVFVFLLAAGQAWAESYPIVDTGQNVCFNNSRQIQCPDVGDSFNGQDAQYKGNQPSYKDNGDGTVTDLVTGLTWIQARGDKMTWNQAMAGAKKCRVGGHDDWRAPSIKELYSLIDFNGWVQRSEADSTPFIDIRYFGFKFGNERAGERIIDCQDWSATEYVSTTMGGNPTVFGVNFADGRIKGYGKSSPRGNGKMYIRYVRGNPDYGKNDFVDNRDGTITDKATCLTWQQKDDGKTYNWEQGLAYCENLNLAGRTDWRLPSVKELQSLVDYTRSPMTTGSAAIDPIFPMSDKEDWFYSSTTHMDGPRPSHASYMAFGRAMGYFAPPRGNQSKKYIDVHGAGAQRSDPKSGNPDDYPEGHGPQGDEIRIYNSIRCVAGGGVEFYKPPYKSVGSFKGGPSHNSPNQMGQRQGQQRGQNMQQGQGMRQGPPLEAYEACSGAYEGAECSFQASHGTISGMCRNMRGETVGVPGHGPGGGPPPRQ